jgi:polysaccharide pyruvyl transferase WcaK-like protein
VVTRIGLINTYSTLNIGDAAIYSALASMAAPATVVACMQDAHPLPVPGVEITPELGACEAWVSVGGDIFNNGREWLITRTFLENLRQLRQRPERTLLFGQSIPRSCHGLSFRALTHCLKRLAAVCVRDAESHHRLQAAGVNAQLSYDAAFALQLHPRAEAEARRKLLEAGIEPGRAALLSVRGFDRMYAHDSGSFREQMVDLSQRLLEQDYQPVVLIQSQAYGSDNDLEVAAALSERVPALRSFDPFHDAAGLAGWQLVMGALRVAGLSVAVRYHTAVLALAAGRVPFNLHYSNKGRDLSERLGIRGCDLASFEPGAQLEAILASGRQHFDDATIRAEVRNTFRHCLECILEQPR